MTLKELSVEYRNSAAILKARISELRRALARDELCEMEKFRLRGRICTLESMYHDTQEAALVMERYYDRRFKRNARYCL